MRIFLIVNPRAGKGRTREFVPRLQRALGRRGDEVETLITRRRVDARDAASSASSDAIVVAGGDGTVNEVVNGLASSGLRTPILPLTFGTSNSLARELGVPPILEDAIALLENGKTRALDLGEVSWPNGIRMLFFLCAGAGLDAWAAHRLARLRKSGTTFGAWTVRVMEGFFRYRYPEIRVSVDGRELAPAQAVIVANLRNYGGPLVVADGASPDDGKLDVVCVRGERRLALLRFVWAAWRARVSKTSGAEIVQGTEVELAGEKVPFQFDGDPAGILPVRVRVRPGAAVFFSP